MTRQLGNVQLDFGDRFDALKLRRAMEHLHRLTQEVNRIQQLLDGGTGGQILAKSGGGDYEGGWEDVDGIEISVTWDSIENKPTEFPPTAHEHPWTQITDAPPFYLIQTAQQVFYDADQFGQGLTIIGVRRAGPTFVYLPHDMPLGRVVAVKDEIGSGDVTVRSY